MKRKNMWISVTIVALVIMGAGVFWFLRKPPMDAAREVPRISRAEIDNILVLSKATFGYPKMLDDDVRADDARITDKDEFEVLVTLVKVESSNPHYVSELETMKTGLLARACEIRQLRFLLYKGITVLLSFKSKDQVDLFQYRITPEMCGE